MQLPKKFAKSSKSFLDRLADGYSSSQNLGSFCAFPVNVNFNGQEKNEHIVLLVRQHIAALLPQLVILFFLAISPILVFVIFKEIDGIGMGMTLGVSIFMILVTISFAVDLFFKWYYSVNIITDERIIDVEFNNILYHRFSEAQLEKIEDVSHAPAGLLSSIFDYGDVFIQTAATKNEFDFHGVPRARDVQDTLLDLLEMKQKGQI